MLQRVQETLPEWFDLDSDAEFVELPVADAESFSVEAELVDGSWGNAVITVVQSLGGSWQTAAGVSTIVTGARLLPEVDCSGAARWGLKLTTKAGAAGKVRIHVARHVER